jgi:parallel beta-helix repeat protein
MTMIPNGFTNPICTLLWLAMATVSWGGSLTPPGPPAATSKPLAEVEPRIALSQANTPGTATAVFRIQNPGSYYLTGNMTVPASSSGIEILSSNVTIDLMGFSIEGAPASIEGIRNGTSVKNITIRNGMISGMGADGIDLIVGSTGVNALIEDITVSNCTTGGIRTLFGTVVRNCVATACGNSSTTGGFILNGGSIAEGCTAYMNNGNGFGTSASTLRGCTATLNKLSGFVVSNGTIAVHCSATNNDTNGFLVASDSMVMECVSDSNGLVSGGAGIQVTGNDNRIERNNCTDNQRGIEVTLGGNFITGNTCSGNTVLNWDIAASNKCLVVNGVNAGAFTGNSGGVSPGSTDPNANYTY